MTENGGIEGHGPRKSTGRAGVGRVDSRAYGRVQRARTLTARSRAKWDRSIELAGRLADKQSIRHACAIAINRERFRSRSPRDYAAW